MTETTVVTHFDEFHVLSSGIVPVRIPHQLSVDEGAVAAPRDGHQRPGDRQQPHDPFRSAAV